MKNKHLITFFSLVIVSILLVWMVIRPAIVDIRKSNESISMQKKKLAELLGEGQSVVENKKNLSEVQGEIHNLEKVWLKSGDELNFITDLESIASLNNVEQVINFDNTRFSSGSIVKTIPLELHLQGELDSLLSYINSIEQLDYYFSIEKIEIKDITSSSVKKLSKQIEGEEVEEAVERLSVKLSGSTYWKN
jgi:hypothetical protein